MSRIILMMPDTDYYTYPYFDMFNQENVTVLKRKQTCPIQNFNKIQDFIHSLYFRRKTRNLIPEFTRKIWYKKYIDIPDTTEKIYFWFFGFYIIASKQFRRYLKKHFPNCKIIYSFFDLAKWYLPYTKNLTKIKEFADVCFTYDLDDAKNYGLKFHKDAYSVLPEAMLESDYCDYDLNFCGLAKDRYKKILSVFDEAIKNNVNCDFNIPELPKEEYLTRPNLTEGKYIPYLDYLKKIQKANCLLEISQGDSTAYTLRPFEAIAYGKKILTNNKELLKEKFYNPKFIQVYDKIEDIDWNWVKEKIPVDYNYIENLSIKKYISDIISVVDSTS